MSKPKKEGAAKVPPVVEAPTNSPKVSTQKSDVAPTQHKKLLIALAVLLAILICGALAAVYFGQHSLRKVSLGGVVVTGSSSPDALRSTLQQRAQTYQLQVIYPDNTSKTFKLEDMGVSVAINDSIDAAMTAQRPKSRLRRLQWWQNERVPLVIQVQDKLFTRFVKRHATRTITPAKNAKLQIKDGKLHVIKEVAGEAHTITNTEAALRKIVADLDTTPITLQKQNVEPKVNEADTQTAQTQIKELLSRKVTLTIDGHVFTPGAKSIGKWIDLETVEKLRTIDVSINSGKVLDYIDSVAEPYVQPPRSQVVLKKSDGSTAVLVPGASGVDVINKDKLAARVADELMAGKNVNAEADIDYAAYQTISAAPYSKWIVVDTTNKRMYAYEKTRLVKTFLVSAGAPETPTPTGSFKITYKVRIQDMRGNNVDGSRYFQPDVEYVNYFAAGGYAIHGNYWRPTSYFGNVNSSHGCVGIRNNDAAWVYTWAPTGTPVIVHT